jgi:hypothetical protein
MKVLGHHHVTDKRELAAVPHFAEDLQKEIACRGSSEKGKPVVATTGDEMQMMLSIAALKSLRHSTKSEKPHPSQTEGWGTLRR